MSWACLTRGLQGPGTEENIDGDGAAGGREADETRAVGAGVRGCGSLFDTRFRETGVQETSTCSVFLPRVTGLHLLLLDCINPEAR